VTNDDGRRVEQKWGFGMAPAKPDVQRHREEAAAAVGKFLAGSTWQPSAEQLSEVKGLYSRAHRQDQWDWFTVWQQLGRPGRPIAQQAASALADLRRALIDGTNDDVTDAAERLCQLGADRQMQAFPRAHVERPGIGYVYVLSTREQPRLLKIGYTDRAVEERVTEINQATGVVYPFGVRAVWAVAQARDVEQELHALLANHRVRRDREFFDLDYREAFPIIRDYVAARRSER
jgi:hypothetical protein